MKAWWYGEPEQGYHGREQRGGRVGRVCRGKGSPPTQMSPLPPRPLCLTDEFKQDMVIACLQHSPNHKSLRKKNGKAIRWEEGFLCVCVCTRERLREREREREGEREGEREKERGRERGKKKEIESEARQ